MLERILTVGFERVRLVSRGGAAGGRRFVDRAQARSFVERALLQPNGADQLRSLLLHATPGVHVSRDADDELVDRVATLLLHGQFEVVSAARDTFVAGEPSTPAEQVAPVDVKEKAWVAFEIRDDATGDPVGDVKVRIELPNKGPAAHTFPSSGVLDFDPCDRGSCTFEADFAGHDLGTTLEVLGWGEPTKRADDLSIPFPNPKNKPYALARITRYHVGPDDTLASIAKGAGLTWQELAEFNFGTSSPDAVNKALHAQVGCRKKTKDRKNYVFSDSDEPGVVYVPRRLSIGGLSTGQTHTLRVRRIARPGRPFVFSS